MSKYVHGAVSNAELSRAVSEFIDSINTHEKACIAATSLVGALAQTTSPKELIGVMDIISQQLNNA
jgi:hypothetical protein